MKPSQAVKVGQVYLVIAPNRNVFERWCITNEINPRDRRAVVYVDNKERLFGNVYHKIVFTDSDFAWFEDCLGFNKLMEYRDIIVSGGYLWSDEAQRANFLAYCRRRIEEECKSRST